MVPDLLLLGKGLSAGYTPLAAVLLREHIVAELRNGMTVEEFRAALVRAKLAPPADSDCRAVVNWLILKGFAKRKG